MGEMYASASSLSYVRKQSEKSFWMEMGGATPSALHLARGVARRLRPGLQAAGLQVDGRSTYGKPLLRS